MSKGGVMSVKELIYVEVDLATAQAYFHEISPLIPIVVNNAELISKLTNLKVYINQDGYIVARNKLSLELRDAIENFIIDKAIEYAKTHNIEKEGKVVVDLNENELMQVIEKVNKTKVDNYGKGYRN